MSRENVELVRERTEGLVASGPPADDLVWSPTPCGTCRLSPDSRRSRNISEATVTDSSPLPGLRRGMTFTLSSWRYAMAAAIGVGLPLSAVREVRAHRSRRDDDLRVGFDSAGRPQPAECRRTRRRRRPSKPPGLLVCRRRAFSGTIPGSPAFCAAREHLRPILKGQFAPSERIAAKSSSVGGRHGRHVGNCPSLRGGHGS